MEKKINRNRPVKYLRRFVMVFALISIFIIWFLLNLISSWLSWKAVFLGNNQVFFGKFIDVPFSDSITLRKAHYIKTDSAGVEGVKDQDIVIAPIREMIHGPKDFMVIYKENILYYENLRAETALFKGLDQYIK